MSKFINKDLATSLTALLFVVIGITGVIMFFHFFDKYVEDMHAILGLVFVAVVFLHVFFNFKSMRNYFNKTIFKILSAAVFVVALAFVLNVKEGVNPKKVIMESLFNTPLQNSAIIFGVDINKFKVDLEKRGFEMQDTIQETALKNKISPFDVVTIMIGK
ncbi:DUF4405 domain-containing protein [Sulfurimonas sp.]|jgi:putative effector of murein hydrolase|uniref:DUF4405 domain-containing protein n=1 Tax=Sulfurimonas sp. TaxID=2022749 RepID=UPI001BBF5CBF|nr:DUF4405 domain-containing protein [Sulfurimonas sp.]MBS4068101.1 DUF4405 domain-containing protein [Sulfurimonas sp.]MDD3855439.1 DUF4405 domain-containing protein [Sulfurimonas sp.]MDX9756563.1 DUF4405 domain-containing protein [Sulfurimonas sp.]